MAAKVSLYGHSEPLWHMVFDCIAVCFCQLLLRHTSGQEDLFMTTMELTTASGTPQASPNLSCYPTYQGLDSATCKG